MKPVFFRSSAAFREWLLKNHAVEKEVWVGFYKKCSGKEGIGYKEAVDEALCFGWIDGTVRRIDDSRYMHRLTPRTKTTIWSAVNIRRIAELTESGLMHPSGLRMFDSRDKKRTGLYSFEQKDEQKLSPAFERKFKAKKKAWDYFQGLAPGYRRHSIHWVMSAKREETREKRLAELIADSDGGRKIKFLTWEPKGKKG